MVGMGDDSASLWGKRPIFKVVSSFREGVHFYFMKLMYILGFASDAWKKFQKISSKMVVVHGDKKSHGIPIPKNHRKNGNKSRISGANF